jgi:ABC-type amino acid transport substrate-binding protein
VAILVKACDSLPAAMFSVRAGFCLLLFLTVSAGAAQPVKVGQTSSAEFFRLYEAILGDAGIEFEMIVAPPQRKRRMFVDGEILIDCCSAIRWRQDREEIAVQLNSRTFINSAEHYFYHLESNAVVKSREDLTKYRFAIVRGFSYRDDDTFGSVVGAQDIQEMMAVVARGRADVGMINPYDFRRRMQKQPLPLRLGNAHEQSPLVIRVHKSRPDLLERINKVIDEYLATDRVIQSIGPINNSERRLMRAGRATSVGFRRVWSVLLAKTGLNVQVVNAPQSRKRMLFASGALVLDCCSIPEWRRLPEEEAVQLYSDVIVETRERYIVKTGSEVTISEVEDLGRYRVAAVRGFSYSFSEHFGTTVLAGSIDGVLDLVAAGRAQIAIVSETDFEQSIKSRPRPLEMRGINARAQLRARVHRDYAYLLPALNGAIAELAAAGKVEELLNAVGVDE